MVAHCCLYPPSVRKGELMRLEIMIRIILYSYLLCSAESFSHVWLFATTWTVARQSPLSMESFRQEYWSGLPCPPPGDHPNPGLPHRRQILYHLSHQGSPWILELVACPLSRRSCWPRNQTRVSCIVGRFLTSWATREALYWHIKS